MGHELLSKFEILQNSIDSYPVGSHRKAIYFLFKDSEVVYVGESKNWFSRLGTHYKSNKLFDKISVVYLDKSARYRSVERKYIKRFQPKYNVFHNTDKSGINLPDHVENHLLDTGKFGKPGEIDRKRVVAEMRNEDIIKFHKNGDVSFGLGTLLKHNIPINTRCDVFPENVNDRYFLVFDDTLDYRMSLENGRVFIPSLLWGSILEDVVFDIPCEMTLRHKDEFDDFVFHIHELSGKMVKLTHVYLDSIKTPLAG